MAIDPSDQNELTDKEVLKELEDHPEQLLKDPNAWMTMADTLRRASTILDTAFKSAQNTVIGLSHKSANGEEIDQQALSEANKNIELFRVSQMLYQMSLENALKGLMVARGKDPMRSHNLTELAQEAGITLDKAEENKLCVMGRMNELGRFRVGGTKKKGFTHGAVGFNDIDKLYSSIQAKISKAWRDLQSGTP